MKSRREKYLDNAKFLAEVVESKKNGAPTAGFCEGLRLLASHMLRSKSFRSYSETLKEDMSSHALLCGIKGLRSFDENKTSNAFGYFTRCTWTAFLQVLNSHYRQVNIKKEMIERSMSEFDRLNSGSRIVKWENDEWTE